MSWQVFLIYWFSISTITFYLFYLDKKRARKDKWRIKESVLLIFTFIGGSLGAFLGMEMLRHKTKHWYFWAVTIASLLLHLIITICLI